MSYFKGKHLTNRIKNFGLEPLAKLLSDVAAGKSTWPQPCVITPQYPEQEEQLRVTIYSILHELGLKPMFHVKSIHNQLILDQKTKMPGIRFGDFRPVAGSTDFKTPDELEPLGDEGYIKMFETEPEDSK